MQDALNHLFLKQELLKTRYSISGDTLELSIIAWQVSPRRLKRCDMLVKPGYCSYWAIDLLMSLAFSTTV